MSGEDGSFDHACRSGGRQRPEGLEGYGVENCQCVRPGWGWVDPAYTRAPDSRVMRPNCPVLNLPPYRGGRVTDCRPPGQQHSSVLDEGQAASDDEWTKLNVSRAVFVVPVLEPHLFHHAIEREPAAAQGYKDLRTDIRSDLH